MNRFLLLILPTLMLAGCAVGPDYVRPPVTLPAHFTEQPGWKIASTQSVVPPTQWWTLYDDPTLNQLQHELLASNQSLAQSEANYRQAQALAGISESALWPTLNLQYSSQKGNSVTTNINSSTILNRHNMSLRASWELDLWGKLRRQLEANLASAAASAADLAAMRLSLQSQLAQNYFSLRSLTSQLDLLQRTVKDYTRSLTIAQNRYAAGVAARGDVDLAQSQIKTTEVQVSDLALQKVQMTHAIAVLLGKNASDFHLPDALLSAKVPELPPMLPSRLLERRPDILSAELQMEAANAKIGVAKAAWFPDISLTGDLGSQTTQWADLLTMPTRIWSVGPALALSVFDAGLRSAQSAQAIAAYDATVATYRQTILTSFQEVEDNLAALRHLRQEAQSQQDAVDAARRALLFAENQYKAGFVDYQNVISAQTSALSAESNQVVIANRQLAASILLIKALGGGWSPQDDKASIMGASAPLDSRPRPNSPQ